MNNIPDYTDQARELCNKTYDTWTGDGSPTSHDFCGACADITAALETAATAERERCAKAIEDHMIYTGPGGHDPEPIQKLLAKVLRGTP